MATIARIAGAAALGLGLALAGAAAAGEPSSAFDRGHGLQTWQDPGYARLVSRCRTPPKPFGIPVSTMTEPPKLAFPPPSAAIPGVIARGRSWKTVWAWQGNNVDGPIAGKGGAVLFANNDAQSVMRVDPATGLAEILYKANTAGAVSRSKSGALFVAERGLPEAIVRLEPTRKVLAEQLRRPAAGMRRRRHQRHLRRQPRRRLRRHLRRRALLRRPQGQGRGLRRGDGRRQRHHPQPGRAPALCGQWHGRGRLRRGGKDGALSNQRAFARLHTGRTADGSTVDAQGRLYVATGAAVDVFAPSGDYLGSIAGPQGLHGVAFGGRDKRTLYGIVFYGGWGSPAARNQLIAIPMQAQGYLGRAK